MSPWNISSYSLPLRRCTNMVIVMVASIQLDYEFTNMAVPIVKPLQNILFELFGKNTLAAKDVKQMKSQVEELADKVLEKFWRGLRDR